MKFITIFLITTFDKKDFIENNLGKRETSKNNSSWIKKLINRDNSK